MEKEFYNIETGLRSKTMMKKQLKKEGYSNEEINKFLNAQEINQIQQQHHSKLYHTITAEPNSFQIDLLFYQADSKYNKGYIGMLLCIEISSRKAFAYPIKNKSLSTMIDVLQQFFNEAKEIKNITTDEGKEFTAKSIEKMFLENNIIHWIKETKDRTSLGKIDRLCRTIRDIIKRYEIAYKTKNYVDVLDLLIKN